MNCTDLRLHYEVLKVAGLSLNVPREFFERAPEDEFSCLSWAVGIPQLKHHTQRMGPPRCLRRHLPFRPAAGRGEILPAHNLATAYGASGAGGGAESGGSGKAVAVALSVRRHALALAMLPAPPSLASSLCLYSSSRLSGHLAHDVQFL